MHLELMHKIFTHSILCSSSQMYSHKASITLIVRGALFNNVTAETTNVEGMCQGCTVDVFEEHCKLPSPTGLLLIKLLARLGVFNQFVSVCVSTSLHPRSKCPTEPTSLLFEISGTIY